MRVGMVLISRPSGKWRSRNNTVLRAATYILEDTNSGVEKGHALDMNDICSLLTLAYLDFRIECENSSDDAHVWSRCQASRRRDHSSESTPILKLNKTYDLLLLLAIGRASSPCRP